MVWWVGCSFLRLDLNRCVRGASRESGRVIFFWVRRLPFSSFAIGYLFHVRHRCRSERMAIEERDLACRYRMTNDQGPWPGRNDDKWTRQSLLTKLIENGEENRTTIDTSAIDQSSQARVLPRGGSALLLPPLRSKKPLKWHTVGFRQPASCLFGPVGPTDWSVSVFNPRHEVRTEI